MVVPPLAVERRDQRKHGDGRIGVFRSEDRPQDRSCDVAYLGNPVVQPQEQEGQGARVVPSAQRLQRALAHVPVGVECDDAHHAPRFGKRRPGPAGVTDADQQRLTHGVLEARELAHAQLLQRLGERRHRARVRRRGELPRHDLARELADFHGRHERLATAGIVPRAPTRLHRRAPAAYVSCRIISYKMRRQAHGTPKAGGDRDARQHAGSVQAWAVALAALAADRVAVPAPGSAGRPAGPDSRPAVRRAGALRRRRHSRGVARDGRRPRTDGGSRPLEPGGGVRRAARSGAAVSLRSGARGLSGPHHDRDPHRPDLHVPADRVAAVSGAPDPDRRRSGGRLAGGDVHDHRPGSVGLRQHRRALPPGAARGPVVSQGRHRHQKRRVQPAHRTARGRRARVARSRAAGRADRRGQVAAGAADLRAQEVAAAGRRRAGGGQLRDAARGRRDVGAVRPHQGRVHRRGRQPRRHVAQGGQGRAVPRRDRRAGPGRAGDAAAGDRGPAVPARGLGSRGRQRLPADRRHQPRSARGDRARALPRGPAGAHRHVDVRAAGPARAGRRHRAQPGVRAGTRGH